MNNKTIYIILGIVVIIILGVSVYYVLRSPETGPSMVGQKTYQSTIYGYEVKYPKQWQAKEVAGALQLTGASGTINVNVTKRNGQSIPEWIKKNITSYNKIKEVGVDNCRATIVEDTSEGSSKIVAVFPYGDYINRDDIVSLVYSPTPKQGLVPVVYAQSIKERVKELEQMLANFKFTENKGIIITDPMPGKIWTEGETYEIHWKPSNPSEKVGIQLYDASFLYAEHPRFRSVSLAKVWTKENIEDTGEYKFTVPVGLHLGKSGGVFQIYISKKEGYGYSPLITITPLAVVDRTLSENLLAELSKNKIARIETEEKVVALTFDADIYTRKQEEMASRREVSFYDEKLVSFLRKEKIPATLFLTGFWIEAYPQITEELAQDPLFELANHSYSHPSFISKCFNMRPIPNSQDREEVKKTEALLEEHAPNFKKYFRFPGLCFDQTDFNIVNKLGYLVIHGDVVGGDGIGKSVPYTIDKVLSHVKPGSIVVLHMQGGYSSPSTAQAIPQIVKELRNRGFRFVKVSKLLTYARGD